MILRFERFFKAGCMMKLPIFLTKNSKKSADLQNLRTFRKFQTV